MKMKNNNFTKTLAVVMTAFVVGGVLFAISAKAEENYVKKYSCDALVKNKKMSSLEYVLSQQEVKKLKNFLRGL